MDDPVFVSGPEATGRELLRRLVGHQRAGGRSNREMAATLGINEATWSRLANGRRGLAVDTVAVRALLAFPSLFFEGAGLHGVRRTV